MGQGEVRAHQRVLGGVAGKPASEILQARGDGAQLVLLGSDRMILRRHSLGMARRLCLLIRDGLDGFGKCGAAADVAPLMIAIVIAGEVAQHVIEWIRPDLCTLPVSVGHEIGVHGQFLSP